MKVQSIYEILLKSLTPDGRLPQSFSLPCKETSPNQLRFVPGAKEGIGIYHTGVGSPEEVATEAVQLLKEIWKVQGPIFATKLFSKERSTQNANDRIATLACENSTISFIDPLLTAIRKNYARINIQSMFEYACAQAFESNEEELVKLGIALLGLIDLTKFKEIKDKLLILALYEEFTLFVVVALSNCENANMLLFKIAQTVDGWGKIHVVERLQAETDDIKDWLLRKGCENTVMDAYLGLECATKGDLINVLRRGNLDEELFEGVSIIINALLDEGPTQGISAYAHAQEALGLYLQIALVRAVTIKHLWYVLNAQSWLEDNEIAGKEELQNLCEEITNKPSWQELIQDTLACPDENQFFFASNTASRLGMDVSPQLFKAVKANPIKHCRYISQLYHNPQYAKELTALYESILPLNQMEKGMGDYLFATVYGAEQGCLDFILQELKKYPNMGERLICTAIASPVSRSRQGAIKVMEAWSEMTGLCLATISMELYAIVSSITPTEIDANKKGRMEKLTEVSL